MTFEVSLLTIGVLLLLLGLIGQVNAQLFKVGTSNKPVRIIAALLGSLFIVLSIVVWLHPTVLFEPKEKEKEEVFLDEPAMWTAANKAFSEGKFKKAFDLFKKSAESGYALSQFRLAEMYRAGHGLDKPDPANAAFWYLKAAEQGDKTSQRRLGDLYRSGAGVTKDQAEAARWYLKAAERGEIEAQYQLAEMYWEGRGVPQDRKEALRWFRQAAMGGSFNAQDRLRAIENAGMVKPD